MNSFPFLGFWWILIRIGAEGCNTNGAWFFGPRIGAGPPSDRFGRFDQFELYSSIMKIAVLLALCAAAIAVAYAAPARIGSGVNLAAMEFGSSKIPGIAYTNYGVPTAKEVRSHRCLYPLLAFHTFLLHFWMDTVRHMACLGPPVEV